MLGNSYPQPLIVVHTVLGGAVARSPSRISGVRFPNWCAPPASPPAPHDRLFGGTTDRSGRCFRLSFAFFTSVSVVASPLLNSWAESPRQMFSGIQNLEALVLAATLR